MVITNSHFLRAVLAIIIAAALRTTGFVARVIKRASANALSFRGRRRLLGWLACWFPGLRSRRIGWLNVKRVTSRSRLGCSPRYISASCVACIHAIKAFVVLAAQDILFVETVAGCLLTLVLESNKLFGIRALGAGASFCFGTAITFDTKVRTSSSGCRDRGVDSLNSAPFVLFPLVIDADGVVLHTTEDVVVTFVVYPRNGAGITLLQRWLLDEFKCFCVSGNVSKCRCGREKDQECGSQFHFEVLLKIEDDTWIFV
jgi:hypothetical protein